ncbi:MAG: TonB-dependent receptor [Campylobacteraceae bacterium]|nr:TonB-dependent receptor [Campylobacteraceae bacterium]
MNNKITISLITCALLSTNLFSLETLGNIEVTSSLIHTDEINATYATEIYSKEDIAKTKSKDIFEFLNTQTSVNIAPNYGNPFAQLIDLRGYGLTNGYQNLVISIDGRRLNNIDMAPQLLSSIAIDSIERIEIIKGSGSVAYGDGANAGVINIITNGKNSNYIKTYYGSNGNKNATLSLGYSTDNFIINAFTDNTSSDGSRNNSSGDKDENFNKNKNINVLFFPNDSLELRVGRLFSNTSVYYGKGLSLDEYKNNPNQSSTFTKGLNDTYTTTLGASYFINKDYTLDIDYSDTDKRSQFLYSSGFLSVYSTEAETLNTKLNIKKDKFKIALGIDIFEAERTATTNKTTKNNKAVFLSVNYMLNNNISLSSGIRKEKVEYIYALNTGSSIDSDSNLHAFDLGINYKINNNSSIFANYNKSFQAPDIDRFFKSGTFNAFIEPAKVQTATLGYTNIQEKNKLKLSIFRSNLENEIYYYKPEFINTNIDKSHKYGFEFFDKYLLSKNYFTSLNYSYIIAKIDNEDKGNGTFNGKDLPGVPKHNVTLNVGYQSKNFSSNISHTYRSSTYSANDFENSFTQKQESYNSTDVNISYTYKTVEFFGKIENLFAEKNGFWTKDDNIYPFNFERTYLAGIKYNF